MKLSEVAIAHGLVTRRRELVKTHVDISTGDIGVGGHPFLPTTLFGYRVDERMAEAVRRAMQAELRAWIAELDGDLAELGVEVEGIEIAIATEEERVAKEEAAKNEAAARAEAKTEEAA